MERYLRETPMLDFSATNIQQLINDRKWRNFDTYHRIKQIYDFVRDEILFGYNVHSWVEVYLDGVWYELEAFILDKAYLSRLQSINSTCIGAFCGYGVAVNDFRRPVIDFERNNTYIQSEGINQDFGIYDCPDDLLKDHHQEMSVLKAFLYKNLGRHLMNHNVKKIRNNTDNAGHF